ncbi:uncharacterized protein KY384_005062 [Bacidia gigantensis]|uniref:uncharacterized protein n=1 Tax=Bacidia gigantensis TaxID=2732470 RepID=UPI001D04CF6D|nr:uncharacterized protein KY384_005062 [Bacidia gigantensis]KAG8530559.1 hypothetical protein KY384_005062 [Bacidia gigantensis]
MASSPSTGSNSPKDAFPDFVEIGPATYYYDPTTTTTTKSSATSNGSTKSPSLKSSLPQPSSSPHPPQLILLATWLSAAPAHITKYLTGYRALYPGVPILLIRSAPPDIVPFNLTDLDKQFAPAVAAIKAACPTPTPFPSPSTPAPSFSNGTANKDRKPQILFHGFSNGGPNQALKLFRAYSKASNNNGAPLPKHVTIFDSCPGHSGLSLLLAALWLSVPKKGSVPLVARWAIILLFHVVAVGYAVAMRVFDKLGVERYGLSKDRITDTDAYTTQAHPTPSSASKQRSSTTTPPPPPPPPQARER